MSGKELQLAADRLLHDLRALNVELNREWDQPWFAPDCRQEVRKACARMLQAESKLTKVSYLISHGATKKAAKIIRIARELRNEARSRWRKAAIKEETFRVQVAQEIHDV